MRCNLAAKVKVQRQRVCQADKLSKRSGANFELLQLSFAVHLVAIRVEIHERVSGANLLWNDRGYNGPLVCRTRNLAVNKPLELVLQLEPAFLEHLPKQLFQLFPRFWQGFSVELAQLLVAEKLSD